MYSQEESKNEKNMETGEGRWPISSTKRRTRSSKGQEWKYAEHKKREYLERVAEKKHERENKPNKQNFKMQTKACSRKEIPGLYTSRVSRLQDEWNVWEG